jgi:hypothetical protein
MEESPSWMMMMMTMTMMMMMMTKIMVIFVLQILFIVLPSVLHQWPAAISPKR